MKKTSTLIALTFTSAVLAAPILQMNKAFMALTDLLPSLLSAESFQDKKNEPIIKEKVKSL